MANFTHVPDKLYAYTLQVRYMLYELLNVKSKITVSTEAFEDVGVETNNSKIAEQIKSSLSDNNPLSNFSTSLWKTLYNWICYIRDGELKLDETIFRLIVISSHKTKIGDIVALLNNAKNHSQAKDSYNKIKSLISSKGSLADAYKDYIAEFLQATNYEIVIKLIEKFELILFEDNFNNSLYNSFMSLPLCRGYEQEIFYNMLGWLDDKVNSFTQKGQPAYIKSEDFYTKLKDTNNLFNPKSVLYDLSKITDSHSKEEVDRHDTYIRQLEIIDQDFATILNAATAYLRVSINQTEWAKRGIVDVSTFDIYSKKVIDCWSRERKLLSFDKPLSEIIFGQKLYLECCAKTESYKINGLEPPASFNEGYLNKLANSPQDAPTIGWHPDYLKLLNTEDKNGK